MALVDDNENDGFSFIWTIQNFSYCLQKTGEGLQSPRFTLNSNNPNGLLLTLFPRGFDNNGDVGVVFQSKGKAKDFRVGYVLSIRTNRGSYKLLPFMVGNFPPYLGAILYFLKKQDIYKKGTDAYLDNDSLTIRCRIRRLSDTILESEQCYARTIVSVERAIYTWSLKTLSDLKAKKLEAKKQINLPEMTSFTVNVSLTKGILNEDKFEMIIKRTNSDKLYFLTCAISLVDTEKVLHSVQKEYWFDVSDGEQIWTTLFAPKTSFLTNSKQNSTIYLNLEFVVSFGVESRKIEKTVSCPIVISKPQMDSDILGSWKDNLRCFYSEGKLTDLTIRTLKKEFPVHKAMLCAQSPVFCAMFERDMKENRTGIVEIKDLEDDTVSMMLLFVYTCSVENLDWEKSSKLYFAADKYEMTALKEKCSVFLKENLTTSNVCKCLFLADTHQDQDLKSVSQDFFVEHSTDIIISDEWKQLIKENSNLAAETMQEMLIRNLKV